MLQTKTKTDITHALHATDVHHTKELYTTEEVRRAMASTADRTPTIILFGAKACKQCRYFKPQLQSLVTKQRIRLRVVNLAKATAGAFEEYKVKWSNRR